MNFIRTIRTAEITYEANVSRLRRVIEIESTNWLMTARVSISKVLILTDQLLTFREGFDGNRS
jgi:hypothetical protein